MPLPAEPEMTINGQPLSVAERMTIRVALGIFMIDMHTIDPDYEMTKLYSAAAKQITAKMKGIKS